MPSGTRPTFAFKFCSAHSFRSLLWAEQKGFAILGSQKEPASCRPAPLFTQALSRADHFFAGKILTRSAMTASMSFSSRSLLRNARLALTTRSENRITVTSASFARR